MNLNIALNFGKLILRTAFVMLVLAVFSGTGPAAERQDLVAGAMIFRIDIRINGVHGDADEWESIARNLLPFKTGDIYSSEKLLETITLLSDSRLFEIIHVPDPETDARGVKILFLLTPFERIEDILVEGAFPLFKREVVNVMTLYPGGAFSKKMLAEQKARIEALFKKEGYPDSKVTLSAQKGRKDGHAIVRVHIEKNFFYKIKKVTIEGNQSFSDFQLKLRIKTWKSSLLFGSAARFSRKDLDADVKNFIRFYRGKGFSDVKVLGESRKNDLGKTIEVLFQIEEGPRYRIGFYGNQKLWDYTLKKETAHLRDRVPNDLVLKKSVRDLQKKYADIGYPDTKIETKTHATIEGKKAFKDVTFLIDEGPQYRVSNIVITGNSNIDEKLIRKQILTQTSGLLTNTGYSPKTLQEDMSAIRALYIKEGYTKARIEKDIKITASPENKTTKTVEITLKIDEGIQTRIGTVHFPGLSVLKSDKAMDLIALKPGEIYREYMIENDESSIRKQVSEMGYPYIQVKGTPAFNADQSRADLVYHVDEGPFVSLGQIVYTGNFRTRKKTLDDQMALSPGDPLSLTKLLESQRNMINMRAIDAVKFRTLGLKEKFREVDLVIETQEKIPYFIEAGTGYDTERHFYLNTTAGDHNFFGRNLALEAGVEVSQIGFLGNISLTEPSFLSTRISSTTKMAYEKREEFNKDFGTSSYSLSQNFNRQIFSEKLTANLEVRYEFREQYLTEIKDPFAEETELYDPRNIFVTSPSLVFRTTDSYVRPRKGIFSALYIDISKGMDNHLDDYVKFRFDTRYYYTLFDPLTIAVMGRYRYAEPYGNNKTVPEDQLFFLGGTTSIRGFDENMLRYDIQGNAVGGQEAILGSIEARYDMGMNFEFTAFYDTGRLKKIPDLVGSEDFRSSAGIGIRYMTPIGPIGFLYGWKLDPLPGESSGSFHFSMGYTF